MEREGGGGGGIIAFSIPTDGGTNTHMREMVFALTICTGAADNSNIVHMFFKFPVWSLLNLHLV